MSKLERNMTSGNMLEIVGFEGVPMGLVGLTTPISRDPDRPWILGKIGTKYRDEIGEGLFQTLTEDGRTTRLPSSLWIEPRKAGYNKNGHRYVIGFVREGLLEDLQVIGSRSSDSLLRFDWQLEPDGKNGKLYTARLRCAKKSEATVTAVDVTKKLFPLDESQYKDMFLELGTRKFWYWLGQQTEANRMLSYWSNGFCDKFDKSWREVKNQLTEVGEEREAWISILQPREQLCLRAIACAYADKQHLLKSSLRLFTCIAEYEEVEELQKRFEHGVRSLIGDVPWDKFYGGVVALREKLRSLPSK